MRRILSIAGAALLATATLTPQAEAQTMSATGSCGAFEGRTDADQMLDAEEYPGNTVPNLFFTVNYQNVAAPTTIGVLVRYDDDLSQQIAQFSTVATNSSGTFRSAVRSSIDPARQGGGFQDARLKNPEGTGGGGLRTNKSRGEARSASRAGASTSRGSQSGQYIGSAGGLGPGLYAFYVYTGQMRDTPQGRTFVADEKNLLGRFTCGVEDDK